MDEKIENGRRKRLGVLEPLAACELDAKRSEKETRYVRAGGRHGKLIFLTFGKPRIEYCPLSGSSLPSCFASSGEIFVSRGG